MEVKTISRLAEMMNRHHLTELELIENGVTIRLCRESFGSAGENNAPGSGIAASSVAPIPAVGGDAADMMDASAEENLEQITAPMPGVFYAAPSQEAAPFVKQGDHIEKGTVVCIVEAMKVMSELKSEYSGVVKNVLVQNGATVEYGQPLFEILVQN